VRLRMPEAAEAVLTTGEWLDRWLEQRTGPRESTIRGYAAHVRLYLRPCLGHILLADLTASPRSSFKPGALCLAPPGHASPSRPAMVAEARDLAAAPTLDAKSAARHARTWTSAGTGSAGTFRRSGATRTCWCRWEAGIRPYHGQPLPIPAC